VVTAEARSHNNKRFAEWLENDKLERLVIEVVRAYAPYDVLERWTFAVETDKEVAEGRRDARGSALPVWVVRHTGM
jgi:hypothetical protein